MPSISGGGASGIVIFFGACSFSAFLRFFFSFHSGFLCMHGLDLGWIGWDGILDWDWIGFWIGLNHIFLRLLSVRLNVRRVPLRLSHDVIL